ncbi:MAG: twin-arginine translocase TatA/TatE family subunit [Spirochaetaceae bacterium]
MLSFVEIAIVGGAILLIFGSTKLPKLGRTMGQSLTEFKKGLKEGMTDTNVTDEKKDEEVADKSDIVNE